MESKTIRNYFLSVLSIIYLVCFISCDTTSEAQELNNNFYTIYALPYSELYYNYPLSFYQAIDPFDYVKDQDSVIISEYNNNLYYNPVNICLRGLNFFDRFMNMQDSVYLDFAYRHRDALITLMDEAYLFEYRMNYHHFDIYFADPWYSGMAQGLALSMLSRMASCSGDTLSEDLAHEVYRTLDPYSQLSRVVVDIDDEGYAWIEEYPGNPPDRTFNGFMHAIIGIYDYYHLLNSSSEVGDVLSIYLTTVRDHMHEYRNPDNISYYCLRHHHIDRTYHKIHVRQLELFSKVTKDSSFYHFADTLRTDYWDW